MGKRIIIALFTAMILITGLELSHDEVYAKKDKWPEELSQNNIHSESAIVMDINSGTILFEKNIDEKQYPASITKIMTTLLCLENASLGDIVTFSYDAVHNIEYNSSHIGVVQDEQLTMEDCLYGIMLMSANEVCNGVAEHVAGSVSEFVKMMNARAKELGCTNTHFVNPNGLFNEKHYTSAHDMAIIARAAMKNPVFRKIAGSERHTIPKTNKEDERYLYHKHEMFHTHNFPKYLYEYCIGGKTGYTQLARYTLVTFAKKDNMELLCVVMRANNSPYIEPNEYTDTIKLFNYVFDNYDSIPIESRIGSDDSEVKYSLFSKYNPIFDDDNSPIYIEENANIILPKGVNINKADKEVQYYDEISESDGGASEIGRIVYSYSGREAGSVKIMYDPSKINTTDLNKKVTEYVSEMDRQKAEADREKEEDKIKEEDGNGGADGLQDDSSKSVKDKFKDNVVLIAVLVVVVVFMLFIVANMIYRARLRKRYLGNYSIMYQGRKRRRYLKKKYRW